MSWTLFKVNVLKAMMSFQFAGDNEAFAEFYANEYHNCIQRGGDMIYGVPVMNGNVQGMIDVMKTALKKGQENGDENFNFLAEIYPAAFDAYWLGAEMAPLPNPLLKPGGWPSTPPAPGTIMNIGPNPIPMAVSAALHKAEVEALKAIEDKLKEQTINIPPIGDVKVYETVQKILKKQPVDKKVAEHPAVKAGKTIVLKVKQAKKKKPSIGSQAKKAIKIPLPELPKKKEIIEKAKNKLIEAAIEELKNQLIIPIEAAILAPIISIITAAIELAESIPNPKPTKAQIKKFVKDTIDGVKPEIELPGITIPTIPKKEEIKKQIEEQIPTKEELKAMAYDLIKDKIPKIPNIHFIPPTIAFSFGTNILLNPFVNMAQLHLLGVSGIMSVMAQYPPPAPPAPAVLNWSGYTIIG
jgi:ASC-1-like (ASCH) protein